RNVMDFNQGGTLTKDLETVIPYINAATQGTRVAMEQFKRNPGATTAKVLQTTAMMSAIGTAATMLAIAGFKDDDDEREDSLIYLDFLDTLTPTQRTNYWNIPISYDKKEGTYKYLSIAKAQSITPLLI